MQATRPEIRTSDDLFTFLLIDVETGGCDTTSLISQAINSVQLYMQRCRLGLEPGVLTDQIPAVWWEWISAYRVWEVNSSEERRVGKEGVRTFRSGRWTHN